jgi:hypothetical protein
LHNRNLSSLCIENCHPKGWIDPFVESINVEINLSTTAKYYPFVAKFGIQGDHFISLCETDFMATPTRGAEIGHKDSGLGCVR